VFASYGSIICWASGVLTWHDCLEYKPAWDTLIWFTGALWFAQMLTASWHVLTTNCQPATCPHNLLLLLLLLLLQSLLAWHAASEQ
jgi:di/tricarboxylate transporter